MLYAYDPNAPGVVAFTQQLKAVVSEQFQNRAEIYDEYLDLNRFPDLDRSPQLARYFAEKYQGFRPDAIVAEGTPALRFATERLSQPLSGRTDRVRERLRAGRRFLRAPRECDRTAAAVAVRLDLLAGAGAAAGCGARRGGQRGLGDGLPPAFHGAAPDHPAPARDGAEGAAGLVLRIAHRQSPSHPASNVRDLLVLLAGPARTEVQCRGPHRQPHPRGVGARVRDRPQLGRQRGRRWWRDGFRGRRHAHRSPPRARPSSRSGRADAPR